MVTRTFCPQGLPLLSGSSLWLDSLLASALRGVFLRSWMEKPVGSAQAPSAPTWLR